MTPLQSTFYVWKALFLREVLSRLFGGRASWFWLLAEPVFHVSYVTVLFAVVRVRHIGGINTALWVACGMLTYFVFSRVANQSAAALSANQALFTYRQVKPVDTLIVRSFVEMFVMFFVFVIVLLLLYLFGVQSLPQDPLSTFEVAFAMWVLGLGYGLFSSALNKMLPEAGRILKFIMKPMYLISGVIFPIAMAPLPYREWLMYNPVAHGLEAMRLSFAPYYHAVPELSVAYMYFWALGLLFLGLLLHRLYAQRLVTQ